MGKNSNLSSYGFNEQPQFDGFINSLKEKADTTEIAEQIKKQESDIKNINDINTKQDEQILGLNVDIKQSGNAFTFTQGGKNLAVINQENGEGSSVIGGSFSNGKLTLNNSNNTSVEIDASSLAFKGDATSIPNLDAYATKQWVEDKKYLTQHQSLDDYAKTSEVSGELAKKSNVWHTHQISDITDLQTQLNDYATEQWVENKGYLTSHQSLDDYAKKTEIPSLEGYYTKTESDGKYALKTNIPSLNGYATEQWVENKGYLTSHQSLDDYAKKTEIPSLEGYATEQWVNSKNYLTSHQSLEDYATKEQLSTKADKKHTHLLKDITDYVAPNLSIYAKKTDIPSLNGYATEEWVTNKGYLTSHQSLEDYYTKTQVDAKLKGISGGTVDLSNYYTKVESDDKYALKTSIPTLDGYATEEWVNQQGYLTSHQSLEGYYTKTESDGKYALKTNIPSLNGYATEEWVNQQGYLTSHQSLEGYYTKTESDGKYALKTNIPSLNGYATEEWVNQQGYLTSHQSLEDYYTKVESDDKYALKASIPTLDGYATEQWVTNQGYLTQHQDLSTYAKKTELANYYTKAESDGKYALSADIPSLNGYATEQWVTNQGYLTTHQSLEDYATKEQLSTKADKEHTHLLKDITDYVAPNLSIYAKKTDIPSLNGYATEEWVNSKGYLTTHQSLTDYAKKAELANYYTKAESDGKYALSVDIPSLNGYATEQWVENKGYLTTHQSLEDYAKKTDLSTKADKEHTHLLKDITDYVAPNLSIYAKKTDIPSLNGYATEQWVNSKGYLTSHQDLTDYARKAEIKTVNGHSLIGSGDIQIEVGSSVDLSNYYTKTDSDGKYALKTSIPSLEGYATEQWVEGKNYLTSHQSLEEYYTKTDSDRKYALKTEIQEVPKFKTVNGQAITGSTDNIEITTDLSNYYKKTETSGATEIRDALANKQDYNENYVTSDQLAGYATTSYVNNELAQKANATDIPTNTIELTFTLTDGSQITKTFYIQL